MLRIRLRRTGAKKKPSYRLVVADARAPRDGAFVDIVGHYNPRTEPSTVVIDVAKAQRWLAHGAQPSDRVARLFKREGIERGTLAPSAAQADAPGATVDGEAAASPDAAPEAVAATTPAPRRGTEARAQASAPAPTAEAPAAAAPPPTTEAAVGEAPAGASEAGAEPTTAAEAPATRTRAPRRPKEAPAAEPTTPVEPA